MAARKKEPATQQIECTICRNSVAVDQYAAHVQSHMSAAPAAIPPAPPPLSALPINPAAVYQPPQPAGLQYQPINTPQQRGGGMQPITPVSAPMLTKDLVGGKYLKGADVPDGTMEVRIRILRFVFDPGGRSKAAAEIEPVYNKTMFGFNTTNIRAVSQFGIADLQQLCGRTLVCVVGMSPNPQQNGQLTKSLFVSRVE